MPASQIHLVRHGEVHNPDGILYGRLPGFGLSALGKKMARSAAAAVKAMDRPVSRLVASPLQRAQESAEPFAAEFGLRIETDERLIEPTNKFEGRTFEFGPQVILRPRSWPWVLNPFRPSWGEPYVSVADRMLAAVEAAWADTESGDVVLVSHQMPIWTLVNYLSGRNLWHDPRKRRCSLSSITTLERSGETFVEVGYQEPSRQLLADSVDSGAV
ncbi:MAG: histidine phosphatase family protein [Cryobacterium sp.]|nr:histidine phosphatase family protein [Cryobacterium sp.]MBX3089907.1 histidine phosphatase family protein [Cryobacterium sp.]MBX3116380.1 histidine phosphatase family protein [Cryobacterium sp.]